MENFEKIKNSKTFEFIAYIIETLASLLVGINIYKLGYKLEDFGNYSRANLLLIAIGIVIIACILIFNIKKYKKDISNLFITFAIPIGILYLTVLPMCWVPDEEGHMFKTYDISKGNIITPLGENNEGSIYVPESMKKIAEESSNENFNYSQLHKFMTQNLKYDNEVAVDTPAKTYFPINYLAGAVTLAICRGLNINILLACYLVRLVNLFLYIILGYLSIKFIPFGKLLLAIYMLMPMAMHQAPSMSADVFINAVSLLFIAFNLKLLYKETDVSNKEKILYYILALCISACKYVYFPLVFMSLLLIQNKNISKKNKIELIVGPIVLSLAISVIWFLFSQKYVDIRLYIKQANVKPIEQLKYIIKNPLKYLKVMYNTLEIDGASYLLTCIGSQLGRLSVKIPEIYGLILLIALVLLPFFEKNEKSLNKKSKWLVVIIGIMLIVLILTGLYLTWSPLHYEKIAGVQGRYFIPVFILFLLAAVKKNNNVKANYLEVKYFVLFFLVNIVSIIKIYNCFL